eukprot:scaffold1078_cov240-Ochromonas_danica.AAC.1
MDATYNLQQIEIFHKKINGKATLEGLIDLGKTPASYIAICEAFDASPFFRSAKKALSSIEGSEGLITTKRQLKLSENHSTLPRMRKATLIDGLQKIVAGVQQTLTSKIIQEGYLETDEFSTLEDHRSLDVISLYGTKGEAAEEDCDVLGVINIEPSNDSRKAPKLKTFTLTKEQSW